MQLTTTFSPRALQFGALAASVATLAMTAPGAWTALQQIAAAPLVLAGQAAAAEAPVQPSTLPRLTPGLGFIVAPFKMEDASPADRAQAAHCLTEAVYYEAGYEPVDGQRAVAQVVLNRVRDPNFPDTVCGVVYQGWWRRTGCQFSFVCDGSLVRRPPTDDEWARASAVAGQALNGYVEYAVGAATHYHTDYVKPYWRRTLVEVAQVGSHVFYRWPGKAGQIAALTETYKGGEVTYWQAAAQRDPAKFDREKAA